MAEGASQTVAGWSRTIDYLFGRNALIALASAMLLMISGYATWAGMQDFIVGAASGGQKAREIAGGIAVSHSFLVVAVTIALTFLMWISLREAIGAQRRLIERLITAPLYLFLVLWSVGFGYGFWWSLIAGTEATRTGLAALQEEARDAGSAVAARLDAVRAQTDSVVSWSESQMAREETSGGSCGTSSGAGRGPLYNARKSVRDAIASLRDNINRSWFTPVQADLELLRKSAAQIEGDTAEDRQRRFEAVSAQIRSSARNIAVRSNELGKTTAAEMRALADSVSIAPTQPGFSCYDPTLAQRLRAAADQAAQPAEIKLRDVAFNEGPAGVANAVKNLWANLGSYLYSAVVYLGSGGNATATTASGQPITGRDMIALLATIGIDLGLFVLALLDPPAAGPMRRDGLQRTLGELHQPSVSVMTQLAAAFETAIARAPGADLEWVRRHFVHHNGASYFVIPNLYSCDDNKDEELKGLAMNQLAGVFDDLKLVKALTTDELKRFGHEESRPSYSDLTPYRDDAEHDQAMPGAHVPRSWLDVITGRTPEAVAPGAAGGRIRNHGLLSKAQRALDIAGWSKRAMQDVEIFKLGDTEGLTPLLSLLNGVSIRTRSGQIEPIAPDDSGGTASGRSDKAQEAQS